MLVKEPTHYVFSLLFTTFGIAVFLNERKCNSESAVSFDCIFHSRWLVSQEAADSIVTEIYFFISYINQSENLQASCLLGIHFSFCLEHGGCTVLFGRCLY